MVESHPFQHRGNRLSTPGTGYTGHPQAVAEVACHRVIEHIGLLMEIYHVMAQPLAYRLPRLAAATQRDVTTVGGFQTGEDLEQRRLACTVAAGEVHDAAGYQRQPADRQHMPFAVALFEP